MTPTFHDLASGRIPQKPVERTEIEEQTEYTCSITLGGFYADSPRDAAEQAQAMLDEPTGALYVWEVTPVDPEGLWLPPSQIDLEERTDK